MQDRTPDPTSSAPARASRLAPDAPIGVFDSGVGGLTVVGALLRRFPNERVLYVADQAHVPYGGRPLDEVGAFATGISRFLADQGCKAVVMACNISSAVALPGVRECLAPLPVMGVIEPAVRRASLGESPRIGVLATAGTVRSGAYSAQIARAKPAAVVTEVACPEFVPLVESRELDSPAARVAAHTYLAPLAEADCSTIILGCTHYPYLLPILAYESERLFANPVEFIDPAHEVATEVERAVALNLDYPNRANVLLTTGDLSAFRSQIPTFLPGVDSHASQAHWTDGVLQLR